MAHCMEVIGHRGQLVDGQPRSVPVYCPNDAKQTANTHKSNPRKQRRDTKRCSAHRMAHL